MPEIKHNFTGGKMNKDLDERLVPNGEYRDAMNIEVLTSEGSEVGTAQNILGNQEIEITTKDWGVFTMPTDSKVVGSISDEKLDTLYYLVTSPDKNMILGCVRNQSPFFVFVDKANILKFNPDTIITGINIIDDLMFWTDNTSEPKRINVKRCRIGTKQSGTVHTRLINDAAGISWASDVDMEEKHVTVIKKTPSKPPVMELTTHRNPGDIYTGVVNVENDDGGVNGSDLGWLTGNGNLANGGNIYNFNTIDVSDDNNNTLMMRIQQGIDAAGNLVPITNIPLELPHWQSGNKVVLKAFDNPLDWNDAPGLPITDYVLKGEIKQIWSDAIKVEFTSQDGQPPLPDLTTIPPQEQLKYAVDLFTEKERLWEFKFPRFSYRYKYEDGEYSPFAPFTQVAFAPGAFDYHPRKGYNIGMTNRLKSVQLSDFIKSDMDQDIVSIDILFKDEPSSVIYIVDTLRPDDDIPSGQSSNHWDSILNGADYVIKSETVNNIVPSNQLLRPWDNVPRKALAQEVSGNRVIYGNYVQNMDLITEEDKKYYADFKPDWTEFPASASEATKSCKSLREYQLGVVFTDKYGRETPVISNASGALKLEKKEGEKANRIKAGLRGNKPPTSATHLKWFIKETANEYYNMAMDRWYYAEDGNIWLAFPSSDRNKVDIDTFLILKKGTDLNDIVTDAARYKILAIEGEAPEFIKTSKLLASSEKHYSPSNWDGTNWLNPGNPLWEASNIDGNPYPGGDVFTVLYQPYASSPGNMLHEYRDGELWVEFGLTGSDETSDKYKIVSLGCSRDFGDPSNYTDEDVYNFQTSKPFGSDINFLLEGTPANPTGMKEGVIVNIYKHYPENLPQFDGKFFVKIYFDDVFKKNIQKTYSTGAKYRIVNSNMVYRLKKEYIEEFTHRMNWWWTPAKMNADPNVHIINHNGADPDHWLQGTRENSMSGSVAYGWQLFPAHGGWYFNFWGYDHNFDFDPYGSYWNGLIAGVYRNQTVGSNDTFSKFWYSGYHYGFMGSDKYAACNIWFKRFLPPSKFLSNNTWGDYGIEVWRNAHYDGSGDKRELSNWKSSDWAGTGVHGPAMTTANDTFWTDSEHDEARETEVWFIDESRYLGSRWEANAPCGNTNGKWGNTGDKIYNENDSSLSSGGPAAPNGITMHSESWSMALSFGGIAGADKFADTNENHFNVGAWNLPNLESANTFYDDWDTVDFVGRLNPGNRFRWKHDPTKSIYTMPPNISAKQYLRHSSASHRWTQDVNVGPNPSVNILAKALNFDHSHNFTKGWRVSHIDQKLMWNPAQEGEITNGLNMTFKICDKNGVSTGTGPSTTGNWGSADGGDVAIYVTDIVATQQGNNQVTGNSNYYNEGNPSLHEGMALKAYDTRDGWYPSYANWSGFSTNGSGFSTGNDFLVIRKIEEESGPSGVFYKLTLGGYNFPMQDRDHEWLYKGAGQELKAPKVGGRYNFVQVGMNGQSPNSEHNINHLGYHLTGLGHEALTPSGAKGGGGIMKRSKTADMSPRGGILGKIAAVGYELQFIEEIKPLETMSENPAIWETEPKESKDLEIYYEASETIPIEFDESNIHEAFPVGTILSNGALPGASIQRNVIGYNGMALIVDGISDPGFVANSIYHATLPSGLYFGYKMLNNSYAVGSNWGVNIKPFIYNANFSLPYHNCYSFGNGVESNRIRDNYNLPYISNGVKASTTLEQEYKEERRKYGLIYSGIYNSTSGVNNLNQFIQAEKITKDVNPIYGSIQKLHSRDSDLVTLCEDKVLKILANKDAVYNADGNTNLTATASVLGQTIPFRGEYGISTNPESFASEAYRAYFSDRVRGAIMRLSVDGLTPISDYGMRDWFKDNLKISNNVIGSYDDRNDEYNIKLVLNGEEDKVLTYNEKIKGWVSFKSFVDMEHAASMANDYYTFKDGALFKHYIENTPRNTFYGIYMDSSIDVLLNDNPGAVKVYNTINYEGSQSKVERFVSITDGTLVLPYQPTTTYTDQDYYNLSDKAGWYVESITTNKEEGKIKEFLEKEGKWFNNINRVIDTGLYKADTSDFTFQGIGMFQIAGCTDPAGDNYNPLATIDDGSCAHAVPSYGCMDDTASNYDANANLDDGSCVWLGCTDSHATNYDPNATMDDGSCYTCVYGCMDPLATNYDPDATCDDGHCMFTVGGTGA